LATSALASGLDVAPRHHAKQQQFEKLVVGERLGAGLAEASAQALAMTVIVRLGHAGFALGLLFQHENSNGDSIACGLAQAPRQG